MAHGFYAARALGLVAVLGASPYALAQDVPTQKTIQKMQQQTAQLASQINIVRSDQRAIRVGQLDSEIQSSRTSQCRAIASGNEEAKSFASQRLQDKLGAYYLLTGHVYYRLPECSEL